MSEAPDPYQYLSPGPYAVYIGTAQLGNGEKAVTIRIDHSTGSTLQPVEPAHARGIAAELIRMAEKAEGSLVTPDLVVARAGDNP